MLFEGDGDALQALNQRIAQRPGAILAVHGLTPDAVSAGAAYVPERLLTERSISVNTAAAGGNASLMTIG
ncbi:Bifunctional protein PutA [compost metagenome]